jgi:O-6-methylguanine DNA methyltransferase
VSNVVATQVVDTALGWIGLAFSETGLRTLTLPRKTKEEAEAHLAASASGDPASRDIADDLPELLQKYALGQNVDFSVPLDLWPATSFFLDVWHATSEIPRGETRSYGWLAAHVGRPGAARAVGMAMQRNPVPIIVPCHRVLAANGGLGGYGGGLDLKRTLLRLEGVYGQ